MSLLQYLQFACAALMITSNVVHASARPERFPFSHSSLSQKWSSASKTFSDENSIGLTLPLDVPNTTAAPSDTAPPSPHYVTRMMMGHFELGVLTLVVVVGYYVALLLSAMAVGESTQVLLMPLKLIGTLAVSAWDCVCITIGAKRKPVGYTGLDFNDDDEAPDDLHNSPAAISS